LAGGPFRSNVYGVPKKTEIDLTTAPYVREAPAPPAAPAPAPLRDVPRRLDPDCAADHLNRLYRLAVGLSRSSVLAEDLVQETYARVLARPRLVSGDEFSYLARALRNVLINHLRSESRRGEVPAPEQLDLPDPRPTADPHTAAQTRELYRTIAGLPDDQRHVIAAVDLAGMTYADAAELLDVPPGTVMSRLYRARERVALDLEL
jgi:RNA polymerase sigma-70 factor (ECF subfamily)